MISRPRYLARLETAVRRSPVTALMGPRQSGKTTLSRMFIKDKKASYYDLESQPDFRRLQNPEMVLGAEEGLVVIDEIQAMPGLFNVLRVLVDRPDKRLRFLILGSASPEIVKNTSQSLAGRVEFVDLPGFDLTETGSENWRRLWLRGGFPRSYLADTDDDSLAWRENFIRTYLERDIPQLGIRIPSQAMRRFWTMLAHYHGQVWNASVLARAMGLSDKTVRGYLDILSGTFMARQLQPWHENLKKRQVKSPKIFLRDSGLLHNLLDIPDWSKLHGHPILGASWEGFALEQFQIIAATREIYFWAAHSGAEVDLFFLHQGCRYGVEIKFQEAPVPTKSMHTAIADLGLEHLWILYPGDKRYPIDEKITACSLQKMDQMLPSPDPINDVPDASEKKRQNQARIKRR